MHASTSCGTPLRRARSFARAPSSRASGDGSGAGSYHGRAPSPRASAPGEDSPRVETAACGPGQLCVTPRAGRPVRRARSFQRVLSPNRARDGPEAGEHTLHTDVSGPPCGRPVRRTGHFERAVSPRRSARGTRHELQWRKRCANSSSSDTDDDDVPLRTTAVTTAAASAVASAAAAAAAAPAEATSDAAAGSDAELDGGTRVMPLADHYDLLACVLSLADGRVLRTAARCSKQLRKLATETLLSAAWRERMATEADVEPRVAVCVLADKPALLQRELDELRPGGRAVVFCLAKRQCDAIHRHLAAASLRCNVIHGDKRAAERTRALAEFASGEVPLLVATGADALREHAALAERLIYYDFPRQMEEYVRRTADLSRRGFHGAVVSFLTSHDLRPLTPGFMQARDDVVRGMLDLCVRGSRRTPVLLGKRDRLLAHRQMLALLKERPVCLGIERGGSRLQTLCTSNLSLVPVERWERCAPPHILPLPPPGPRLPTDAPYAKPPH